MLWICHRGGGCTIPLAPVHMMLSLSSTVESDIKTVTSRAGFENNVDEHIDSQLFLNFSLHCKTLLCILAFLS